MRYVMLMAVLMLSGCMTTSDVVPAGKDSYMVQSSARGGLAMGSENVRALKAANEYCNKMGKVMMIRRTDATGSFNYASSSLIFSCLDENDPEYKRPNLRKDPTTVVEDQRQR